MTFDDPSTTTDATGDEKHDCTEALHELYHFLDGECSEAKREQIRQHLEDCPPCFEAFDFEAEIKVFVSSKCREKATDDLRARIADAIGHEPSN